MDSYSTNYSSNSSSTPKPFYSGSSVHSVRRAPAKPWRKPVAPLPPAQPRVYKVDPINFRDLVQKLTAAPEYLSASDAAASRLQALAPPPVEDDGVVLLRRPKESLSNVYKEFSEVLAAENKRPRSATSTETASSQGGFLGLNLSPSTAHNWCSFPMLSPGTLSTFEHSTVL